MKHHPDALRVLTDVLEAVEWHERAHAADHGFDEFDSKGLAEAVLRELPEPWELAKHEHTWVDGRTYTSIPPRLTRSCRCGATQVLRRPEWVDE